MTGEQELERLRTLGLVVFDVAVNSLNFLSGFLDQEEIDALKAFAGMLGIDPAWADLDARHGLESVRSESGPR